MATLSVVMVLFFILAMVAAYTNRTLIVDQRASANNLRGAMAMEAAEAGIEWAITQLNGPRATLTCVSSDQVADLEFRSRFLTFNPEDGTWEVKKFALGGLTYPYNPSCVANAGTWSCSCPTAAAPTPSLTLPPDGLGQAFRVTFQVIRGPSYPAHAGTIGILSQGCSNLGSSGNDCISTASVPEVDAVAQTTASVGLVRALPYAPAAAITAGTTIDGTTMRVSNEDPSTGLTVHAGGAITIATAQLTGPAGSGSDGRMGGDPALAARALVGGRFFESLFGMDVNNYRRQPGLKIVDCTVACTSAQLADPLARYPGRVIWLDGDVTLDSAGTIGSAAQPAVLIVTGTLTLNAAVNYYGVLYANVVNWSGGAASAFVNGAIVSANQFQATATATVAYDATILSTISRSYGSFVRVPGGNQFF